MICCPSLTPELLTILLLRKFSKAAIGTNTWSLVNHMGHHYSSQHYLDGSFGTCGA